MALAYVLVLVIVALEVPLGTSLRDRVDTEVRSEARSQADVIAATASDSLAQGRRGALDALVSRAGRAVRGRVVLVDRRGDVVSDSAGSSTRGVDYSSRPEIRRALEGSSDQRERHSDTLDTDILATAVPVVHEARPIGALRITQSVAAVDRAVRRSTAALFLVGVLVLGAGLLIAVFIAGQIAGPLRRLEGAASRITAGDLETRAAVEGSSEQRSLAVAFNVMTERLARLLRGQREFVADASHQLRTPLTGLRLRIEEAQAAPTREDAAEELEAATRELDRLSHTIDDLLLLSRAGERDLPGTPVDLAGAAGDAAQRWMGAAAQAEIQVEAVADAPGRAFCARVDLDRALDALIENAIAYSPAGSRIEVVARAAGIDVLDEGPGIAAGEAETIFERFRRGSAGSAGPSGTGLGLPIARELMVPWQGTVTLENRPGAGGRASIAFPGFTEPLPEGT